jgi:hypothetical protein
MNPIRCAGKSADANTGRIGDGVRKGRCDDSDRALILALGSKRIEGITGVGEENVDPRRARERGDAVVAQ